MEDVFIYPNSTKQYLSLVSEYKVRPLHVDVFDLSGKKVARFYLTTKNQQINLEKLKPAIYILRIKDQNGSPIKSYSITKY